MFTVLSRPEMPASVLAPHWQIHTTASQNQPGSPGPPLLVEPFTTELCPPWLGRPQVTFCPTQCSPTSRALSRPICVSYLPHLPLWATMVSTPCSAPCSREVSVELDLSKPQCLSYKVALYSSSTEITHTALSAIPGTPNLKC